MEEGMEGCGWRGLMRMVVVVAGVVMIVVLIVMMVIVRLVT